MKRSEMINILKQSLWKHYQDMTCCDTDEVAVFHILNDLEKAGMLPPAYNNLNSGFNQIIPTNKWEEDD